MSSKKNSGQIISLIVQIEDWIQRILIKRYSKRFTNEII